jgi:hypothetical protein
VFHLNIQYGKSTLDTDRDVAYSQRGELGNNENKNKIKNWIREVHTRTIRESAFQDKNGASVLAAAFIA